MTWGDSVAPLSCSCGTRAVTNPMLLVPPVMSAAGREPVYTMDFSS